MTQPEALRLADLIDKVPYRGTHEAAAELRRLHAENEAMRNGNEIWVEAATDRMRKLQEVNDELLDALEGMQNILYAEAGIRSVGVDALIAKHKATGESK